jgi:hypothetical protein
MTDFVLVHSPVTGPATWRWVAAELTCRGHRVIVPSVPPAVTSHGCRAFISSVVAQASQLSRPVLVGHSGAGPVLPEIGARLGASTLVFADADAPPAEGEASLVPAEFLGFLRGLSAGGQLPPWSDWFGPAMMSDLVPDDARRRAVTDELPRLPLSYFTGQAPVPAGWISRSCGYILFSEEAYGGQAAAARARGWPVAEVPGGHLELVTQPEAVASAIIMILAALPG